MPISAEVKFEPAQDMWQVRSPFGMGLVKSTHGTKKQAEKAGREWAKNIASVQHRSVKLKIKRKDGTIQDTVTHDPGKPGSDVLI